MEGPFFVEKTPRGVTASFSNHWSGGHPRQQKQLLQLRKPELKSDKVLLEYRGQSGPARSPDSRAGYFSAQRNTADFSPKTQKMSVNSDDSSNDESFSQPDIFCEVCYLVECRHCSATGRPQPSTSDSGPWNGHSARDSLDRITCPLLYFFPQLLTQSTQLQSTSQCTGSG